MSFPVEFQLPVSPGMLSVVVPVGHDPEGLRRTLASLKAARQPAGGMQIIVGNDGADPTVSDIAAAYNVEEVAVSPNGGSYVARNRALAQARGEWIGFVDADAMVDPTWAETGVTILEEVDYACGSVVVPRHTAVSPGRIFDWLNAFPVARHFEGGHFGPTVNLFVRRGVFERLGGFDPRLRSGGDVEFGSRVHAAGIFRQVYRSQLVVYHLPRSYREQMRKMLRITRGQCDLARYHPDRFGHLKPTWWSMMRNLMPPRELTFLKHTPEEFGPRAVGLKPLFYLMAWSFKLQRLRAQLRYLVPHLSASAASIPRPSPSSGSPKNATLN